MPDDVAQWLEGLGLGKYSEAFTENDLDFDVLSELTDAELKELGVSLGDRKRILRAIANLGDGEAAGEAVSEAAPAMREAVSEAAPATREAERRQLTVLFCDLVGSTELSRQLDPEDLRDVMRRYQDAVSVGVTRYKGHVAKFLGDGVLAYFGWPRAYEDEAERAVRAGLDAVAEVRALQLAGDLELMARVGIDTGLVVIGDMVGEAAAEADAVVGETPNRAARLQGLAAPNHVVIGSTTRLLVGEAFELEDLGDHDLKGFDEPVTAWRVLGESSAESRFEAAHPDALTQIVGREHELGLLRRAWEQSQEGVGQVVLITGEPGIGKSRLVDALGAELKDEGFRRITLGCSPYHSNSALYPLIVHLQRLLGWQDGDSAEAKLVKLEQALQGFSLVPNEVVPLFAELLSLPLKDDRYPPLNMTPQEQKQQTLDAVVAWLLEEAERQPVLQVWEDLHWADPSTLELLSLEIDQVPTAPILTVLTFRPDFVPPWPQRSHMTPLTLNRLERPEVEALIMRQVDGKALPADVIEHIATKTDGVPLYVEELTKAILEADFLREKSDHYELTKSLSEVTIPATLQDSLMARLDRRPAVREVAQLGAVLGREFAYEMLLAIASIEEPTLKNELDHLVSAELIYQRGRPPRAKYTFKHVLVQDVAYQSLLRRTRQQYHKQVGQLLETRFPETVEAQPELVAHHYTEAGLNEQAVDYWQKAGVRDVHQAANLEAIDHFNKALELIETLPPNTERTRQKLALYIGLAQTLSVAKGYAAAEVGDVYTQARQFCDQAGDIPQHLTVLRGLWIFHFVRGRLQTARELGEECLALAQREDDPAAFLDGYHTLGGVLFCLAEFTAAQEHLEQGIALYDPQSQRADFLYGAIVGVLPRCFMAHNLWHLGYPDRALQRMEDALALARELSHPFSMALALDYAAMLHQFRRENAKAQEWAEAAIELCTERGYAYYLAWGTIIQGWTLVEQRADAEKIAQMRQGLDALRATGAELRLPYYLVTLAEASGKAGRIDEGLAYLNEAQEAAHKNGETWREAERFRLHGEFLLAKSADSRDEAEACFQQALDVARRQQAKSLELRAAMSLSRLWRQQDKTSEAHTLLSESYNWFTEGFETPDLVDARALLDALR